MGPEIILVENDESSPIEKKPRVSFAEKMEKRKFDIEAGKI